MGFDSLAPPLHVPQKRGKKKSKKLYDRNGQQKMRGTTQSW